MTKIFRQCGLLRWLNKTRVSARVIRFFGNAIHGKGPPNRALAEPIGLAWLWPHALPLTLAHPVDGRPITPRAEPGPEWRRWLPPGGAGRRDA